MVDLETNCVIDLLATKNREKVECWLATFPNIKIVSRDGSTSYRAAITSVHPEAIQISDRFHLVKNLTESISEFWKHLIKGRIEIPLTSESAELRYEYLTSFSRRDRILEAKRMHSEGLSFKKIAKKLLVSPTTVANYVKLKEGSIPEETKTVREQKHANSISKVQSKYNEVIELKNQGFSKKEISEMTGISTECITKYLKPNFNPANGRYGSSRSGKLSPFRNEIIEMRAKGITYKKITEHIRSKGYTGTVDALRVFVSKEKRLTKDIASSKDPTELIDKRWIKKLLYKPADEIKEITKAQLDQVYKKYPEIKSSLVLLEDFRTLLCHKR